MKKIALFLAVVTLISASALSNYGEKDAGSVGNSPARSGLSQGSKGAKAEIGDWSAFCFGA